MKKKILNLVILLIVLYLVISAVYVFVHINFGPSPEIVGMGFSESNNTVRKIMGLPETFTTYQGVSPIYLIEVVIKLGLGIIFLVYLYKSYKTKNI